MKIAVEIDGKKLIFPREEYVKAKTKQLREFGYTNLTTDEVDKQIDALITGKTFGKGLTVIGGFMQDEILVPQPKLTP